MPDGVDDIQWAPRVPPYKIRMLYEQDARGIRDEALIDEVAYGLCARCESILTVSAAERGRVSCPHCGCVIARPRGGKDVVLHCPECGWETTWGAYHETYQHKQLSGGGAVSGFREYVERLPRCRTPVDKVLLIDTLIHACHKVMRAGEKEALYTRPAAVNLVGGNMKQVMALLEELAYGPGSVSGAEERKELWQAQVLTGVRELQRRGRG